MARAELCLLSISELAERIERREVSPVEVTEATLSRIYATQQKTNAYVTILEKEAIEAARHAEAEIRQGQHRGPLHGVPMGLKDLFYTQGVRTTAGSRILRDFVPKEDATVVSRFKEAGAIIMGKLNMNEFAYGATGENPTYGDVRNPWDPERITGGSSSGSGAAVAAFSAFGALGSDTGGSIRVPASLCGIVGLKPTYGRVSRYGVFPLSWSQDHVGPMTRTVKDAAIVLNCIAGHDPKDPTSSTELVPDYSEALRGDLKGIRLGIVREFGEERLEDEVKAAFQEALRHMERDLGASVQEVSIPTIRHGAAISLTILASEAAAYHGHNLRTRLMDYSPDVRRRLLLGELIYSADYVQAQRARKLLIEEFQRAFQRVDLIVAPSQNVTAPRIGQSTIRVQDVEGDVRLMLTRFCRPFNSAGLPAISIPCGFSKEGLPIGLQIVGRPFEESTVLRAAHAYEVSTPWHLKRPPM